MKRPHHAWARQIKVMFSASLRYVPVIALEGKIRMETRNIGSTLVATDVNFSLFVIEEILLISLIKQKAFYLHL